MTEGEENMIQRKQKWIIVWSSSTGAGNDEFLCPAIFSADVAHRRWEDLHPGLKCEEIISAGEVYEDEET